MECFSSILEMGKTLLGLAGPWVGYHNNLDTNMETLKRKTKQLNGRNNDLEVRGLKNAFKRAVLGNRAVETIKEVEKLHENGEFSNGLLIDDPTCGHAIPTAESLAETTSVRNKEKIWNFLMDDMVRKIGVLGMGGVGKTTIMKHINNQLLDETRNFCDVMWVTVSKAFEIKNVQRQIAKKLNLDLSDYEDELCSASEIHNMLSQKKKHLLILDDLWKAFPLGEVGILEPTRDNGCKLVLTTRLLEVCTKMNFRTVEMELLTEEEALNLFMKNAEGHQTLLTLEVKEITKEVTKKCACLPFAIVTMAGCMRGVNDIREWRNARNAQQLIDEERKELIEYWIAEDLIREKDTTDAMIDDGHTILNELIRSCLLEKELPSIPPICPLLTTFLLRASLSKVLQNIPDSFFLHMLCLKVLDLSYTAIESLPNSISMLENLHQLLLRHCYELKYVPSLEKLKALEHFEPTRSRIEVPQGIEELVNLRKLGLSENDYLQYVPSLEKLKALEHFELSGSEIEEVPQGIEELVNLKRLIFYNCPKMENIFSALFLHNFPNLEELQVVDHENVEEIIVEVETGDRGGHREDDGNTITLPNLVMLHLQELPRLKSIYKGIMVCESLQEICVYKCPMLRRLPISLYMNEDGEQASAPPALRIISGEEKWWESLEWNYPLTKTTLQPFFSSC
ncbi:putative disease resistance protein [Camellia lanceoleosa]|uniref:Disease resistance protein n=1 Tax=Camellia lanceoleosa TaxID=1840588 RepID=A0ACC0IQU7_9ERIC|nr:putative disease resistance protein [Camellia lanceoleosa]